jgi:hypothetical protein
MVDTAGRHNVFCPPQNGEKDDKDKETELYNLQGANRCVANRASGK